MAGISGIRHPYHGIENVFDISHLASRDPLLQFTAWFDQIRENKAVEEPNAMAVATATKSGVPSIRMVLCKEFDEKGFLFFTNYGSKKGHELDENPKCSLMFYWEPVKRQVRIEGVAEKISAEKSAEYFYSRPKDSQIGAIVSKQSSVIPDRQVLDTQLKELQLQYSGNASVPKPDYWGGYLVRPYEYEFWQGQTNRLHDRLRFRKLNDGESFDEKLMQKGDNGWIIERLSS
ncbi:pyridoxine-5'-phosphate oxidase-like [Dreissena polymorpha]|uniref:pyridoxine-5'-phosphate oxidase-like n=1 Tax=Dreissena polymorpha TaxID=45954 RepID=UPI002263F636|nr:pyridoxine-5'-phosphate oxidase-like [Dreissena polymorpha]